MSEEIDYEERAKSVGWTPKEEFRGDPEKWVDAETFVKRAEHSMPILRANNEKLYGTVETLKTEIQDMKSTFSEFSEYHKKQTQEAEKRGYEKARREILAKQKEAVADADTAAWERLEQEKIQLDQDFQKVQQAPAQQTQQPAQQSAGDPDFSAWAQKNTWYLDDPESKMEADALAPYVRAKHPDLTGQAFYDKVAEQVRKNMPHKFENQSREAPSTVVDDQVAPSGGTRKQARNYNNLPAEAKAACERFVAQGLMTKEEYLASYDWE